MEGSVTATVNHVCAKCNRRATRRFEVARIKHTKREYRPLWWAPMIRRRYTCYECMPTLIKELKAKGMNVGPPERIG